MLFLAPENVGHGRIFPRRDGFRASCGGPWLCADCARDLAWLREVLPALVEEVANAETCEFLEAAESVMRPYADS